VERIDSRPAGQHRQYWIADSSRPADRGDRDERDAADVAPPAATETA
jgi:hypothetical protein